MYNNYIGLSLNAGTAKEHLRLPLSTAQNIAIQSLGSSGCSKLAAGYLHVSLLLIVGHIIASSVN